MQIITPWKQKMVHKGIVLYLYMQHAFLYQYAEAYFILCPVQIVFRNYLFQATTETTGSSLSTQSVAYSGG